MKNIKIMLIEDNEDHAELVKIALEEKNLTDDYIHINDGEKALDCLLEGQCKPELILLDLRLPKIDGLEVLRQLKKNEKTKKLPVVILTTSKNEIDIARAYDFHANSYLVKPVDYKKLTELIKELGFYWLEINEKPKEVEKTRDK